jgi:hypothetical protein
MQWIQSNLHWVLWYCVVHPIGCAYFSENVVASLLQWRPNGLWDNSSLAALLYWIDNIRSSWLSRAQLRVLWPSVLCMNGLATQEFFDVKGDASTRLCLILCISLVRNMSYVPELNFFNMDWSTCFTPFWPTNLVLSLFTICVTTCFDSEHGAMPNFMY